MRQNLHDMVLHRCRPSENPFIVLKVYLERHRPLRQYYRSMNEARWEVCTMPDASAVRSRGSPDLGKGISKMGNMLGRTSLDEYVIQPFLSSTPTVLFETCTQSSGLRVRFRAPPANIIRRSLEVKSIMQQMVFPF